VISIQWSVTETDIVDEYQVTLNATYQTQVPTPVLLIEPTAVNLPNLQIGEVFTGEMTITNYGLVRADDVLFTPPPSDSYFRYEFMGTVPSSLEEHQRISLPYKITALAPLPSGTTASSINPSQRATAVAMSTKSLALTKDSSVAKATSSANSSSGCHTYSAPVKLDAASVCANGTQTKEGASGVFARVYGQCTSTSGSGGSGGSGGGNDANGFGGPLYGAPIGQPLGNSAGCTPICTSCLLQGGGLGGGAGSGPMGPTSGGGNPPPIVLGSRP
jgi:hypothetical protein